MEYLRHPNVINLYEVVETPSRLHLVLEYAGGGDLHNRICNEGKLSDNTCKITFAQILSAIKYMASDAKTSSTSLWLFLPIMHLAIYLSKNYAVKPKQLKLQKSSLQTCQKAI